MNGFVALGLMTAGGAVAALQAPLNAALARHTGRLGAALASFAVGALLLTALAAVTGSLGGLGRVGDVEHVYLLGGVVGAVYVLSSLGAVSRIGAGALAAAVITGQLAAAVLLIDRLGLLGVEPAGISLQRIAGVALLLAGTLALASR